MKKKKGIMIKIKRYSDGMCSVEGLRRHFSFEANLDRLRRAGLSPIKEGESRRIRLIIEEAIGKKKP